MSLPCLIPIMIQKLSLVPLKANKITKYEELSGKTVGVKNGTAAQRSSKANKKINTVNKTFDTGDLMNKQSMLVL